LHRKPLFFSGPTGEDKATVIIIRKINAGFMLNRY